MRSRGLTYGLLAIVAIVVGVVASGMPSRRNDPALRITAAASADTSTSTPSSVTGGASTPSTTTTPVHDAGTVTVLVANATGITGAATKRADDLRRRGYVALTPVDATEHSGVTGVFYVLGAQGDAAAVARLIGAPVGAVRPMPEPLPVRDLQAASVLVVLGDDRANA